MINSHYFARGRYVLVAALCALGARDSVAQTVTLGAFTCSPSPCPATVKEGDDFFSLQMNNPLDMNQRRDIMWEENFTDTPADRSVASSGGVWSGKFASTGGYVFPLFAGFPDSMNQGLVGAKYPIDTTKYTYVAARRKLSANPSTWAVNWGHTTNFPPGTAATQRADFDGYFTNTSGVRFTAGRYQMDRYDFRGSDTQSVDWRSSPVKTLRLDPSTGGVAGTVVSYDWVRVVDPTSTTILTIPWTASTIPVNVCFTTPKAFVFVDDNNSGFDGALVADPVTSATGNSSGSATVPLAILPPGTYYFYVEIHNMCNGDAVNATSGYSAAITINGKAGVTVDNPSKTTGPDYATDVLGNAWDMAASDDIANFPPANTQAQRQWINQSFTNPVGAFSATAEGPYPGAVETDAQVWMKTSSSRPINTKKYRYFTVDFNIDEANFTTIANKVEFGWVSRAIWYNQGIQEDGSDAKGEVVLEGQRAYTIDLTPVDANSDGKDDILDPSDTFAKQSGWTGNPFVSTFRFDPQETSVATNFTIYDVKLRGRPEPVAANTFTIQATVTDPESNNVTTQFFRDSDNTGFDGTLLGTVAASAPGVKTLLVNTTTMFPGDFWIYVTVTDSLGNVTRRYGDAPVHIVPQLWQPFFAVDTLETPFVGDFTGDGKADIITFARQNPAAFGDVYVAKSNGSIFVDSAGNAGSSDKWHDFFAINTAEQVVIGDFNNDNKDDIATWLSTTSRQVYVALSTGTGMTSETVWVNSIGSASSDLVFAGDANGDGKDDLICFARTEGKVYVALSDGTKFGTPTVWHPFFAVSTYERPRVGDVNGDGKADIITFATDSPSAFGDVYVAVSNGSSFRDSGGGQNSDKWHDFFAIRPTEEVRVGDINGDGKADFFTFLPSPFGQVYVVQSQGTSMGPNNLWMNEEGVMASTDIPFVGDVTGDGKVDIIIFQKVPGQVRVVKTP